MKYHLSDLIDVALVERLTDLFYKTTGIPASLNDLEGKILAGSGLQDACTKFDRVNRETRQRYVESDNATASQLEARHRDNVYRYKSGLIDAAMPITIEGVHIGNFFTGQFLFEPPDLNLFREQALRYGFNEEDYLQAAATVPVVDKKRLTSILDVLSELAEIIAAMGLGQLKQKETQEAIRKSEALLKTVVEGIIDPIYVKDLFGRYLLFNRAAAEITGKDRQEVLGKDDTFLFPPDEAKTIMDADRAVMETGTPQTYEENLVMASGEKETLLATKYPFVNQQGQVVGLFGITRNITERKLVEEELGATKDYLATVFNNVYDAIFVHDLDGNILDVNNKMLQMFGVTREEAIGSRIIPDYSDPGYSEDYLLSIWEKVTSGENQFFQWKARRPKDGSLFDVEVFLTRLSPPGRHYVLANVRDITERKRAEKELLAHARFFENMDKVNRAVQGTNDLDQMMGDVLEVMLSIFDCDRAWLVYPCDPEAASWRVAMERSRPEYPGACATAAGEIPMDPNVVKVLQTMRTSNGPVTFGPGSDQPLVGEIPERFCEQSQIAMLLNVKTGRPWLFGMHQCSYPRVWAPEEKKLFEEIGRRMSDALTGLLTYHDLHENEERHRVILQTAMDGFCRTDMEGRFLEVNEAYCRMTGYSAEELLSMGITDMKASKDPDTTLSRYRKLQELGVDRFESVHQRKDRSLFDVEISVQYIGDGQAVVFLRDITERKKADEALKSSERRLQAIVDGSPAPMFVIDKAHQIIHWNRALEEYSGARAKDMVGTLPCQGRAFYQEERPSMADLLVDGDLEAVDKWYPGISNRSRLIEGAFEGTSFFPHLHGGSWIYFTAAPIHDAHGAVIGAVETLIDITDRKKMEEELRRSRDELELRVKERTEELRRQAELMELSHEAIFVKDLNSRITYWSRGAEETYGWTKEEAADSISYQLLKSQAPLAFADCLAILKKEGRWDGEITHTAKNGEQITVLSRQALQRNKDGEPTAVFELNVDITGERRLEDQLREAHKLKAIGTLAGGIAHNFNNILAAILGNAELALDDVDEDSPVRGNLDQIAKASLRARDHVKEILAFSRQSIIETKPLHAAGVLRETFNLLRASIPSTIQMNLRITATSDVIVSDRSQLQQVIMNLVTNAAQAMPDGGSIEIGLLDTRIDSCHPAPDSDLGPGEYLQLSVRDTGTGIDESVRGRIFEPFFTTREVGKGTGLGLSVAYGIAKGCGGTITVESQPEKGSIFRVYLPKASDNVEVVPKAKETPPQRAGNILFVDDEEPLRLIAEAMLSRLGYEVTTEGDPVEAFNRFCHNPEAFDVIITDYTMPNMTGLKFSREILQRKPGIPILLCTGHNDAIDEKSAKEAGIREFLMKPLRKQKLAEVIGRTLVKKK